MNSLVWKEWRENRTLALAGPVLAAVFVVTYAVYARSSASWSSNLIRAETAANLSGVLVAVWLLMALLAGSSMIAPEVGQRTLGLLLSLPISRGRIWLTKLTVAGAIGIGSSLASVLAFAIVCWICARVGLLGAGPIWPSALDSAVEYGTLFYVPVFAIAALVSVLFDRTISAFVAATLTASVVYSVTVTAVHMLDDAGHVQWQGWNIPLACGLVAFGCFAQSYRIFARGENLNTSKRFRLLLLPTRFVVSTMIIGGAIVISLLWLLW